MQRIIEDIIDRCQDRGVVESDRATARLALLVVLDHLDRALVHDEMEELAAAMPAGLAVMLQRRRGYDRPSIELVQPELVAIVCEVLASHPIDPAVARKLARDVPRRLLQAPTEGHRRHVGAGVAYDERPTLRVVAQLRPTIAPVTLDQRRTA